MSTPFDALEHQLHSLRPSRLPAPARQRILHEMERQVRGHESVSRLFGHRTGFQVALAGALSLALVVAWHSLPWPPHPASRVNQVALAASNGLLPSLFSWEAKLASASPMGANTVAVLRSPSILTNGQIQR